MSRIGKLPIAIPGGVTVTVNGVHVVVQGPKGKLERDVPPQCTVSVQDVSGKKAIVVARKGEDRVSRSMQGLTRTLLDNMVKGVVTPFKQGIEVAGVGYKVELTGRQLKLQVGFSHDVIVQVPAEIEVSVEKATIINLSSANKEMLGQLAATLRAYKPCEPYQGKGIKYAGEQIRRKEGKTGAG